MPLANSTTIPVTTEITFDGVFVAEIECDAVVDWDDTDSGLDWEIESFRFKEYERYPLYGVKHATIRKDHPLFGMIRESLNSKWLEAKLIERNELHISSSDQRRAML